LIGGRYNQQSDGLYISNITSSDEGAYNCQAVVESIGMFKEQQVTLKLLGTHTAAQQHFVAECPVPVITSILTSLTVVPANAF